ncbi:1,2-epoxyphenylacetyl-CoA isomerase, partial [Filimonas sp.]
YFIQAFSKIGLIPDSGGTYFLPRLVGFQKAAAYMMLGDKIMAEEAERVGMIYKVFSDESFKEESRKLATLLAQMPTKAIALTKSLLNQSYANTLTAQLNLEGKLQVEAADSHDYKEGVNAFLENANRSLKEINEQCFDDGMSSDIHPFWYAFVGAGAHCLVLFQGSMEKGMVDLVGHHPGRSRSSVGDNRL